MAAGCREAGCTLIGGETAEMPGFYQLGEYDLAGFAVGVVERDAIWDGSRIRAGDVLLGLASSGLHSNGFSLARRVLFEQRGWTAGTLLSAARACLGPDLDGRGQVHTGGRTADPYQDLCEERAGPQGPFRSGAVVKGAAHITGGGLTENVPRVLPDGLGAVVRHGSWPVPPVFQADPG